MDGTGRENVESGEAWFERNLTLRETCIRAAAWLESHAVEEPRSNAELLLMHVLGLDRAALLFGWNELFPSEKEEEWKSLVQRKAQGEPIQYMIGEQWFHGRPFAVSPAVLIPRPETELLVEAVLEAADRLWPSAAGHDAPAPTVVDVGTGSGAIAVTLAAQRPRWRVCASDLSPDALEVARTNAIRHHTADRMAFVQGDLLAPFLRGREQQEHVGLRIDVLVSNPPYIPAADLQGLQREVRDYEPRLALDGGADGLDPYRIMLEQLRSLEQIPAIVAFELGIGQPRVIAQMMREMGEWDDIRTITDYGGIERHIIAVRSKHDGKR